MRIVVTGSSGLVGSALVAALHDEAHDVVRLVRRPPRRGDEARWDPGAGTLDGAALEGCDAVVNLAGVGIGDRRWTPAQKRRVRDSRVKGTRLLSTALAGLDRPPAVLVSGSAVGYYGDGGDAPLDESGPPGDGFLAEVVAAWEDATGAAAEAGIRVVHLRSGVVLSRSGGALGRVLPLFRIGLGGRLGSGRQWFSWVTLEDEVRLILHAVGTPEVVGAMNATAPDPVTNADYTRALASALGRPAVLPVPGIALAAVLGRGITTEIVLVSQRVVPRRALDTGFVFRHPEIGPALRAVLGRP